jgi:hypothetical protein
MSALNVFAEIEIAAEPTDVAGVMFDPAREPEWVEAVTTVEVIDPSIRPGARVKRAGRVKGFPVQWTTEVESFHFPHMLTLRVAEGPFNGTMQYQVGRSGTGSIARVAIVGEAAVPAFFPAPLIADKVRGALTMDLRRLKAIIETPAAS